MQTTIRRFLTLFLCWLVMVGAMLSPLTAYASDPTQDGRNNNNHHVIKDNGDGSYSIIQTNKKAQSPNVGVTVGYQITAGGKTITIPRNASYAGGRDIKTIGPQESKASNGYTYVTYETRVSGETAKQILAMLNSNGEVRMDHVMAVSSDGGNTTSSVWSDKLGKFIANPDCANLSWFSKIMESSGGDGAYDMNEMEAFMKGTFAWMDPKSWETNWMKLLKLAETGDIEALADALKELEEEKEDKEDKTTTLPSTKEWIHRASTPITQVYTYNDSRNYEDEQGKHAGICAVVDDNGLCEI